MCSVGSVVQAVGGMFTSSVKADADATSKEQQATSEAQASAERANRIYARGQSFRAEQRLQQISGNVEQSGSALEVGKADAAQIELDALTELYGGTTRATTLREEARLERENSPHAMITKASRGVNNLIHGHYIWKALGGEKFGDKISGLEGNNKAHANTERIVYGKGFNSYGRY